MALEFGVTVRVKVSKRSKGSELSLRIDSVKAMEDENNSNVTDLPINSKQL